MEKTSYAVDSAALDEPIIKRSVTIKGHRTSVSMEAPFWESLKDIARRDGLSLNRLIGAIDDAKTGNLSSALRVFVLNTFLADKT